MGFHHMVDMRMPSTDREPDVLWQYKTSGLYGSQESKKREKNLHVRNKKGESLSGVC